MSDEKKETMKMFKCTDEDIKQVEDNVKTIRGSHAQEISVYLKGGIFMKNKDRLRFSTKKQVKIFFIDILPARFVDYKKGKEKFIDQRYYDTDAHPRMKEDMLDLYAKIYNGECLPHQDLPRQVNGAIDAIRHILISVLLKRPSRADYRQVVEDLIEEYNGMTLHDLIEEMDLSTRMPIGDPMRSAAGKIVKRQICKKHGINQEAFTTRHRKVKVPYGNIKVLKYYKDDLDVVRDCILHLLEIPNHVGEKRLLEDSSRKG